MNATAFDGIRVIDASQGLAGPGAAQLLAQYGAQVIKVEPPEGDWARRRGQTAGDHSTLSVSLNMGKRSIALDLKHTDGALVLRRLLSGADVFIESFRPGVMDRLGFGYSVVSQARPAMIYASVSGFGQHGPLSERPAIDSVMQAYCGMMSVNTGESDGMPHRIGFFPVDVVTGLYAFQAIAVALYARRHHGRGQQIDCSLLQSALALQSLRLIQHAAGGPGHATPTSCPLGTYRTSDGWINLTVSKDSQWPVFCGVIEEPALAADEAFVTAQGRIARHAEINSIVAEALASQSSQFWSERLAAAGIMHERVRSYADVLSDDDIAASGLFDYLFVQGLGNLPVVRTPGLSGAAPAMLPPSTGGHTESILRELGYSQDDISGLERSGAISGCKE